MLTSARTLVESAKTPTRHLPAFTFRSYCITMKSAIVALAFGAVSANAFVTPNAIVGRVATRSARQASGHALNTPTSLDTSTRVSSKVASLEVDPKNEGNWYDDFARRG